MSEFDVEAKAEMEVLARMLVDADITSKVLDIVNKDHFRNNLNQWLFNQIKDHYIQFKKPITFGILRYTLDNVVDKEDAEKRELLSEIVKKTKRIKNDEKNNVDFWITKIRTIKEHCEQSEFLEKLREKFERMDTHGFDDVISSYQPASKNGKILLPPDLDDDLDQDLEKNENDEKEDPYLTIPFYDDKTDFRQIFKRKLKPRYGLFISTIAGSKFGKSTFYVNLGIAARRIGFNVLDIILEGTQDYIKAQYRSCISKIQVDRILNKELTSEEKDLIKLKFSKLKGKLKPYKMEDLTYDYKHVHNVVKSVEDSWGKRVHIVFIRPVSGLVPFGRASSDEGLRGAKVNLYKESKWFSELDGGRLLFVEDHAKTQSWYNKDLTKSDVAEHNGASKDVDLMLGLANTINEHNNRKCRLQCIASRISSEGAQVKLRRDFDYARFINGW